MYSLVILLACVGWTIASSPPEIRKEDAGDHIQLVKVGESMWLPCPVDDEPSLISTWSKDGESIHRGWTRFKIKQGGLRIKDVELEDAGSYVCRATNGYGYDEYAYRLYVKSNDSSVTSLPDMQDKEFINTDGLGEAPVWVRPDQMETTLLRPVDSTLRLKCAATGRPRPQILWYKDTSPYRNREAMGFSDEEGDDARWTLKLKNLRPHDSGHYTCKVSNSHGSIEHTYLLEVVDRLERPRIKSPHPLNATVSYGKMASFQCRVQSDVKPTIQWLKRVNFLEEINKQNKTIEIDGQHFVVLPSMETIGYNDGSYVNKLIIPSAKHRDAGRYICLGVNSMGTSFKDAYLHVEPQNDGYEVPRKETNGSLVLIIAVPATILLVVVSVVIYCLCKKSHGQHSPKSVNHPAAAASSTIVGNGVQGHTRPTSSSSSVPHHHPQDSSKHYYSYTPVPVHQHQLRSQNIYQAPLLPQHHHHNSYLHNGGGMHSYGGEYEYPLINSGNSSSMLPPSTTSVSPQQQQQQQQQDVILTNYGEIHSDGSGGGGPPRNTTPNPSQHSSASSHTYMPAPLSGLHSHPHYTVA